nr:hypothetical protein [Catenuloplanes indicus]
MRGAERRVDVPHPLVRIHRDLGRREIVEHVRIAAERLPDAAARVQQHAGHGRVRCGAVLHLVELVLGEQRGAAAEPALRRDQVAADLEQLAGDHAVAVVEQRVAAQPVQQRVGLLRLVVREVVLGELDHGVQAVLVADLGELAVDLHRAIGLPGRAPGRGRVQQDLAAVRRIRLGLGLGRQRVLPQPPAVPHHHAANLPDISHRSAASTSSAAFRAAISTGSQTGANGGA